MYYVTFTLASVCAGAIVYREFDCMSPSQPPLFSAGCLTTFIGVFLTASKSARPVRPASFRLQPPRLLRDCCMRTGANDTVAAAWPLRGRCVAALY